MEVDRFDCALDEQVAVTFDHRVQRAIGTSAARFEQRSMARIAYIQPGERAARTRSNACELIREGMLRSVQNMHNESAARLDRIPQIALRSEHEVDRGFTIACHNQR